MELPPLLRNAVDRALSGMPLDQLTATAAGEKVLGRAIAVAVLD